MGKSFCELSFDEFQILASVAGFHSRQCTAFHWQIRKGSDILNYFPTKGNAQLDGKKGILGQSPDQAISLLKAVVYGQIKQTVVSSYVPKSNQSVNQSKYF